MKELYKKYRPKDLKDIIGQESAVKQLTKLLKNDDLPHSLLFTGPSGVGKTTFVRILRRLLHCSKYDFSENNVRKIEEVRDIAARMNKAPIAGKVRIFYLDEAHMMTGDAMDEILKMLEDTPNHVYFMLATTNPQKLKNTIRTRCTEIVLKSLSAKNLEQLINSILAKEESPIPTKGEVVDKIIECSDGSARKALVLLQQIIKLDNEKDMLEAVQRSTNEAASIDIARALINPRTNWYAMAKVLKENDDKDAEQLRWMILGYTKNVLISGGKLSGRAWTIIEVFKNNFYDSKYAGLTAACYTIINGS